MIRPLLSSVPDRRRVLAPDALLMMDAIARSGSFAAAAREPGRVPSAPTCGARKVQRSRAPARLCTAWRSLQTDDGRRAPLGLALQWWVQLLENPVTRAAMLERHAGLII
jgi:hypothetical protein